MFTVVALLLNFRRRVAVDCHGLLCWRVITPSQGPNLFGLILGLTPRIFYVGPFPSKDSQRTKSVVSTTTKANVEMIFIHPPAAGHFVIFAGLWEEVPREC